MSERTFHVLFECGHKAHIWEDEHGDGSAWCQACGDFKCYTDLTSEGASGE